MLMDDEAILTTDPLLAAFAASNGRKADAVRRGVGVYEVGHFGGSHWPPRYEHYPNLGEFSSYGVCDSPEQVIEKYGATLSDKWRRFVLLITPVLRGEQPASGGWRWHKWGPYIGDQKPTCEYLHDEPEIELVYVFHIYERM